ncbi:hypothetical protein ACJX0J_040886, partial [Zea mays]
MLAQSDLISNNISIVLLFLKYIRFYFKILAIKLSTLQQFKNYLNFVEDSINNSFTKFSIIRIMWIYVGCSRLEMTSTECIIRMSLVGIPFTWIQINCMTPCLTILLELTSRPMLRVIIKDDRGRKKYAGLFNFPILDVTIQIFSCLAVASLQLVNGDISILGDDQESRTHDIESSNLYNLQ